MGKKQGLSTIKLRSHKERAKLADEHERSQLPPVIREAKDLDIKQKKQKPVKKQNKSEYLKQHVQRFKTGLGAKTLVDLTKHLKASPKHLKKAQKKFNALPAQKWLPIGLVGLVVATTLTVVNLGGSGSGKKETAASASKDQGQADVLSSSDAKPDYDVPIPKDRDHKEVFYNPERKIASYSTTVGLQEVTVSMQPLPEEFKTDPAGKVKEFAEQAYVKEIIESNGQAAYLGNSIKGPQTLILTKSGLLIFITSEAKIEKEQWQELLGAL